MKKPEHVKILVIGDIMLDKYVVGEVNRISPEAPVGIVNVTEEYHTLGGCGNVVKNIRELGAEVDCLSSIASDINGQIISNELKRIGVGNLLFQGSDRTTVKERIISDQRHVQMLRIDRETIKTINSKIAINTIEMVEEFNYNMIIISDYAKGMISEELMQYLKTKNVKIIVDPKPINGYMYNGVYMITPNENEWNTMKLSSKYNLRNVSFFLITKGKYGMKLIENGGDYYFWDIPAEPVDIYNVSGAGDTVVAIMAVCLSMGWKELDSAIIANKCAAYVITQPGTSAIPKDRFIELISKYQDGDF
jgi:rfaE bifunctional protein kinase chain/domain